MWLPANIESIPKEYVNNLLNNKKNFFFFAFRICLFCIMIVTVVNYTEYWVNWKYCLIVVDKC